MRNRAVRCAVCGKNCSLIKGLRIRKQTGEPKQGSPVCFVSIWFCGNALHDIPISVLCKAARISSAIHTLCIHSSFFLRTTNQNTIAIGITDTRRHPLRPCILIVSAVVAASCMSNDHAVALGVQKCALCCAENSRKCKCCCENAFYQSFFHCCFHRTKSFLNRN